tara:strand:- start:16 stop:363 length:348 start_codon:yes stop_codon:yes gene_type:complete
MASSFKNAALTLSDIDSSSANLYTSGGSAKSVIHALYISNKSSTTVLKVNVKVTADGGSTFTFVGKSLEVDVNNTLVLDKPINLEENDVLRVYADSNIDSSAIEAEAFASILEVT